MVVLPVLYEFNLRISTWLQYIQELLRVVCNHIIVVVVVVVVVVVYFQTVYRCYSEIRRFLLPKHAKQHSPDPAHYKKLSRQHHLILVKYPYLKSNPWPKISVLPRCSQSSRWISHMHDIYMVKVQFKTLRWRHYKAHATQSPGPERRRYVCTVELILAECTRRRKSAAFMHDVTSQWRSLPSIHSKYL